jgi:cation:H+ antiporter
LLVAVLFVVLSLAIILLAAELFTNSVEWLGHRLGLEEGPVGSILAAVGTAMPETMIPIIAILVIGSEDAHEIGVGAILGAPFLLSTAAFSVTGLGVLYFQRQRRHGKTMPVDVAVIKRDLGYFFLVYLFAIASSFLPGEAAKYGVAALLLGLYGYYVYRTFKHEGAPAVAGEEELKPLYLDKYTGGADGPPGLVMITAQFFAALGLIIGGAQIFVTNLEHISHELGIPALVLALVIAPLATELPEKFNSIIWVRQGKDTLAMGNISGAMVFQSCVPVSLGVVFTAWELTEAAIVSATIALASTGIVYLSLGQLGHLSASVLARAGVFWVGFVAYVVVKLAS